jgi:hypothetical protein
MNKIKRKKHLKNKRSIVGFLVKKINDRLRSNDIIIDYITIYVEILIIYAIFGVLVYLTSFLCNNIKL